MEKLLVINGCSHSAGSEIPGAGIGDSRECRNKSFGALLAKQLGRKPIHLAIPGGSNDWILRTSMAWVGDHLMKIRNKEIDVIFLVHWTGAERWEYRFPNKPFVTPHINYDHDTEYRNFTIGSKHNDDLGKYPNEIFKLFTKMFAEGTQFWSDNKIKNIIALQSFLQVMGIPFWFGNAFDTFTKTKTYDSTNILVHRQYFPHLENINKSYYWFCKNHGFDNQDKTGELWHLGADAHEFYAKFLKNEFDLLGYN